MITMSPSRELAQRLVEAGLLKSDVVRRAQTESQSAGESLAGTLVRAGWVDDQALAAYFCEREDFAYFPLSRYQMDPAVWSLVPVDWARRHLAVPLGRMGDVWTVVMVDPTDHTAREALEKMTESHVVAFVGRYSEILEVLGRAASKAA